MFSLSTQSKTILQALAPMLSLGALTLSIASAGSLAIVNPNFSAVAVQCSGGYAYQSFMAKDCGIPRQDFNKVAGAGWTLAPLTTATNGGTGVTDPDTALQPPLFTGLPFSQAAFLQGNQDAQFSQIIAGFVRDSQYTLSFYLGSRYSGGCCDGNQSVEAKIDGQVIGTWALVSYTPFTLETVNLTVASGGLHTLTFAGAASGDHTAFVSGVSIETAADQE
jgi:hypothetical protein